MTGRLANASGLDVQVAARKFGRTVIGALHDVKVLVDDYIGTSRQKARTHILTGREGSWTDQDAAILT